MPSLSQQSPFYTFDDIIESYIQSCLVGQMSPQIRYRTDFSFPNNWIHTAGSEGRHSDEPYKARPEVDRIGEIPKLPIQKFQIYCVKTIN